MNSEIRIEVLPPAGSFSSVRLRVTDYEGRKTEVGMSPELTIGTAVRIATENHFKEIAREEMRRWAYPYPKG